MQRRVQAASLTARRAYRKPPRAGRAGRLGLCALRLWVSLLAQEAAIARRLSLGVLGVAALAALALSSGCHGRFLRAHLFAQEEAVGFFCDAGRECALIWRDPPGPWDVRVLRHELVHQHIAARLRGRLPTWLEEGLAERISLGIDIDGPFGGTL